MKKLTTVISIIGLVLFVNNGLSQQKGAEALLRKPVSRTVDDTNVEIQRVERHSFVQKEKSRLTYSVHSRGFVGNFEVVTLRERGLWGNGSLTQLLVDKDGNPVAVLNSSASAGPGVALVQGASFVGGMYMFGEHLKPSNQNVNNSGNASASGGRGGDGGNGGTGGHSTSFSTSTGNTSSTINNATTSNSSVVNNPSSTFVPPGHINNPGHHHN